jgi:hypothetical protein
MESEGSGTAVVNVTVRGLFYGLTETGVNAANSLVVPQ